MVWGGGEESAMKTVYFLWAFNQLSPPPPSRGKELKAKSLMEEWLSGVSMVE